MTEFNTADTADTGNNTSEHTYASDNASIRQAARDFRRSQGQAGEEDYSQPPVKVDLADEIGPYDKHNGITLKRAGEALSRVHQKQAEERRALDEALGLTEPEATQEQQVAEPTDTQQPSAKEQMQNAAVAEAQAAAAAAQQQYAAAVQVRAQYTEALGQAQQIMLATWLRDFPDVRSQQDLANLYQHDPARYQQAVARIQESQVVAQAQQQQQQAAAAEYGQLYEGWSAFQDQEHVARNPEVYRDPAVARQLQEHAVKMLLDTGVTPQELKAAWDGNATISLRNSHVQDLLLKACKYDLATNRIKAEPSSRQCSARAPATAGSPLNTPLWPPPRKKLTAIQTRFAPQRNC